MGLAILFGLAIGIAWFFSRTMSRAWMAAVMAGAAASTLFQLLAFLKQGYVDPFIVIAFTVSTALALATSAVTVIVDRLARRAMHDRRPPSK